MTSWNTIVFETDQPGNLALSVRAAFDQIANDTQQNSVEYHIMLPHEQSVLDDRVMVYTIADIDPEAVRSAITSRYFQCWQRCVWSSGSDTASRVSAVLFENYDDIEAVDRQACPKYPGFLEGYFYHNHDFKMVEKSDAGVDYPYTPDPLTYTIDDPQCPNCGCGDIMETEDLAHRECRQCRYREVPFAFDPDHYMYRAEYEIARRNRDIRTPAAKDRASE